MRRSGRSSLSGRGAEAQRVRTRSSEAGECWRHIPLDSLAGSCRTGPIAGAHNHGLIRPRKDSDGCRDSIRRTGCPPTVRLHHAATPNAPRRGGLVRHRRGEGNATFGDTVPHSQKEARFPPSEVQTGQLWCSGRRRRPKGNTGSGQFRLGSRSTTDRWNVAAPAAPIGAAATLAPAWQDGRWLFGGGLNAQVPGGDCQERPA